MKTHDPCETPELVRNYLNNGLMENLKNISGLFTLDLQTLGKTVYSQTTARKLLLN